MKKQLLLAFCFYAVWVSAQTNRFIYEFQFRQSVSMPAQDTTKVVVDITDGLVKAFPQGFLADKRYEPYPLVVMAQMIDRKVGKPNNTSTFRDGEFSYTLDTEDAIKWEIEPESKKIEDFPVQKAVASFGGRKWTAWFDAEIPIPEGPYKFNGLPGLIVEVADNEGDYRFSLKEIKKINTPTDYSVLNHYYGKDRLVVNWPKFNKVLSYRYHDPWLLHGRDPLAGVVSLVIDGKQIKSQNDFNEAMRGRSSVYKDVFDCFLEKGLVNIK